jgi:hypothetical protein
MLDAAVGLTGALKMGPLIIWQMFQVVNVIGDEGDKLAQVMCDSLVGHRADA